MPPKKSAAKQHVHYRMDGTIYGKGQLRNGVMVGYWEWFRKDGVRMRSGSFEHGVQVGEWTTYDRKGKVVKVTIMRAKGKGGQVGELQGAAFKMTSSVSVRRI